MTNEQKLAIHEAIISQFEQQAYSNEVMGKTWQTIGNAEMAKKSAEGLAENTKAIADQRRQMEELTK